MSLEIVTEAVHKRRLEIAPPERTHYDRDIKEAEERLRPFVRGPRKRHGLAVLLVLASWADAGDDWAGLELDRSVSRDVLLFTILHLEIVDFAKCWRGKAWGAEGAMGLLRCTSRQPKITEMLQDLMR